VLILVFQIHGPEIIRLPHQGRGGKVYKSFKLAKAALGRTFKDAQIIDEKENFQIIIGNSSGFSDLQMTRLLVDVEKYALEIIEKSDFLQVHRVMNT
jgi:hypothetical protein